MKYITISQLLKLKGVLWAENISPPATEAEIFAWHAADELASMLELFLELEQLYTVAPKAMTALRGLQDYFTEKGKPRPYTLEALLLRSDRLLAFMDPDEGLPNTDQE